MAERNLDGYTVLDGEFGTVRPEIKLAFPYFGETIRVHPNASDVEWMGFIDSMRDTPMEDVDTAEVMNATLGFIKGQIHPDDWDLFRTTATKNRQNSVDLMGVAQAIVGAVAGFPTTPPDDSSHGRKPMDHLSKGGSQRQATSRRRGRAREAATIRAIETAESEGRGDISLVLLENYEHQTGSKLDPASLTG